MTDEGVYDIGSGVEMWQRLDMSYISAYSAYKPPAFTALISSHQARTTIVGTN